MGRFFIASHDGTFEEITEEEFNYRMEVLKTMSQDKIAVPSQGTTRETILQATIARISRVSDRINNMTLLLRDKTDVLIGNESPNEVARDKEVRPPAEVGGKIDEIMSAVEYLETVARAAEEEIERYTSTVAF